MGSDYLRRVADAAQSTNSPLRAEPPTELQEAVASAVESGAALTDIAAAADLPSLAVLDAIDAQRAVDPK